MQFQLNVHCNRINLWYDIYFVVSNSNVDVNLLIVEIQVMQMRYVF